ncbi:MAG: ATP synthase subunit I [Rhodoferax sp.]|nr:ATP synthase subunit I [Rhodoferax sp.]
MAMNREALQDEDGQPPFRRLGAEEAQQLRLGQPQLSPWRVIRWQVLMGLLAALIVALVTGRQSAVWSAVYGAMVVILPAARFARGVTGRLSSLNAGAAVAGFFFWEMFKIGLSVVLLAIAVRMVPELSWPALLTGLVLTIKVYWLALWWAPRRVRANLT